MASPTEPSSDAAMACGVSPAPLISARTSMLPEAMEGSCNSTSSDFSESPGACSTRCTGGAGWLASAESVPLSLPPGVSAENGLTASLPFASTACVSIAL